MSDDDGNVEILQESLIEVDLDEFSIVFDPVSESAWVEFPDDEKEEITLEEPGLSISEDRLSQLPPVAIEGQKRRLTVRDFEELKAKVLA